MSYRPSSIYASNTNQNTTTSFLNSGSSSQSSALQTRINSKKNELENLKQLRDLSAALAEQMTALEQKLATLRDGTEAVAHVLQNWDGVLGVIGMAGAKVANLAGDSEISEQQHNHDGDASSIEPKLPVTLVRIPVQDTKAEPNV